MNKPPELLPGEEICPDCSGTGLAEDYRKYQFPPMCGKCWGAGKLDWIQMAMGKSMNPCSSIVLPKLRTVYPRLIAQDIVGCHPIKET